MTPDLHKKPFYAYSSLQALVAIGVAIALGKGTGSRRAEKQTRGERNMKYGWSEFHPEALGNSASAVKKKHDE
jgi:hypothetical protein